MRVLHLGAVQPQPDSFSADQHGHNLLKAVGNARIAVTIGSNLSPSLGVNNAAIVCSEGIQKIRSLLSWQPYHWPEGQDVELVNVSTGDSYATIPAASLPTYTHTGYVFALFWGYRYKSDIDFAVVALNPLEDSPAVNSWVFVNFYGEDLDMEIDGSPVGTVPDGGVLYEPSTPSTTSTVQLKKADTTTVLSNTLSSDTQLRGVVVYPPGFSATSSTARAAVNRFFWNREIQYFA